MCITDFKKIKSTVSYTEKGLRKSPLNKGSNIPSTHCLCFPQALVQTHLSAWGASHPAGELQSVLMTQLEA